MTKRLLLAAVIYQIQSPLSQSYFTPTKAPEAVIQLGYKQSVLTPIKAPITAEKGPCPPISRAHNKSKVVVSPDSKVRRTLFAQYQSASVG